VSWCTRQTYRPCLFCQPQPIPSPPGHSKHHMAPPATLTVIWLAPCCCTYECSLGACCLQSRKYPILCPDPGCHLELGVGDIMTLLKDEPSTLQVGTVRPNSYFGHRLSGQLDLVILKGQVG
jgi:hypothetical protein